MSPLRILGIVLLILGIVLLVAGLNASHSVADQTKDFFVGRYTDQTATYIFGGLAMAIVGLLMTLFGVRKLD
ncbi:MAG TPA: DUF3185 family protein [Phycisphaerae bacterium]|nr:DUF3185 family protein [Phycisphaerae bacterium]